MMGDAAANFIKTEVAPHKYKFEEKDYKLTEDLMVKAGA